MVKKAIFLDIDGTILESLSGIKQIRPKVEQAIRSLQEKGHYVFIATGRPYAFLTKSILEFGFDGFILANGAQVIVNNETIHCEFIDKSFIQELTSKLEEKKVQYILQGPTYSYLNESHQEFSNLYDQVGLSRDWFESNFKIEEVDIFKVEMFCMNEEIYQDCLGLIADHDEYDHVSSINNQICALYSKKNTKGTAILKTLEHLSISVENSFAFGDGKNDIEMLSTVGCGIAMGNAADEVKKYTHKITDTVHNDGVAVGIEQYFL